MSETLSSYLQVHAAKQADAPAVLAPDREVLTYGKLWSLVESTRQSLGQLGLGPDDRVAVIAGPWGPEAAVSTVAVMSGMAAILTDSALTADELRVLFQEARATGLLADQGLDTPAREVARSLGMQVVELVPRLDHAAGDFAVSSDHGAPPRQPRPARPADIAVIGTTTGTTAKPKLIARSQQVFIAACRAWAPVFDLSPRDRYLTLIPLHTTFGLFMAVSSLLEGGTAVCPPRFDPAQLLDWIADLGVTWYAGNLPVQEAVLAAAARDPSVVARCSLRMIMHSGTDLPPPLVPELEGVFGAAVRPCYGMTDAFMVTHVPAGMAATKPGSVGVPLGVELRVVDDAGVTLPARQAGEIVLRGPFVVESYLNDPEYSGANHRDGWFLTGDLGVLDADGYLTITGRVKEQINRGGDKVSPAEVEEALKQHPAVADAAVFAIPHPSLGEDVAAAVVTTGEGATEAVLRDFALDRLAPHKVPRRFVFVQSIPREMGKIPRAGLAEQLGIGPWRARADEKASPSTETERRLAEIWRRVLELDDHIARDEDFFELGGDSLLAVQMLAEVERVLGVRVSQSTVLSSARLDDLAAAIDEDADSPPASPLVQVQEGEALLPLFWVHGGTGLIFNASRLAFHLGSAQPVYAFQPRGMDGKEPMSTSVEEMAADYLEAMREVQPRGPYLLGGHSFGGLTAFEMACRLEALGEAVELLAMADSHYPEPTQLFWLIRQRARYFLRAGRREKAESARRFARRQVKRAQHVVSPRSTTVRSFEPKTEAAPEVTETIAAAGRRYQPRRYGGRVTYFRAESPEDPAAATKWGRMAAGGIEIHEVPGNHNLCMREPHIGILAGKLRGSLRSIQAGRYPGDARAMHATLGNQEVG